MHHEYRRPCSRSRPCHERSTGDIKETPGGQLGDSKGPAGRHSEGSKISYMDQCTFGAGPLRGARGPRARQRPAKKSEHARIFPFSFAPLTLNVRDGREIVLDPTLAKQPRGLRPHGLPHEVKPLKGNRLCQKGITARATTSSACQPSSGSMKARCAPSCTTVNHGSLRRTSAISSTSATRARPSAALMVTKGVRLLFVPLGAPKRC